MSNDSTASMYASIESEIMDLAKDLSISMQAASDVHYLRTRNRWTQELEDELIAKHKAGESINIFNFGVTEETQRNLMEKVRETLVAEKHFSPEEATSMCGLGEEKTSR